MRALLCMLLLAGAATAFAARAQEAGGAGPTGPEARPTEHGSAGSCEVPAYLIVSDSVLGKVAAKVKAERALNVLVIGSGSSTLSGADGVASAYPARLAAYLAKKLGGASVNVATDLHPRQTAEAVVETIDKVVTEHKPTLVIWQTGTVDAMKSVDLVDFRSAIMEGVAELKAAGADVILMNLQYNPRMETMVSVGAYLDTMRVVAQELDVPLFDRFSVMRHWTETGDFDLGSTTHTLGMAKSVHDCIGRALAQAVVEASRLNPAELRTSK